jgi:phosphohistidine phosphatase
LNPIAMPARSLFLVRHAIAAERGDKWPDDNERPLTHEGAARMRVVVKGLRALGVGVDVIVTSPLVRAAATAELLARGLTEAPKVITAPALAPGASPAGVAEALEPYGKAHAVAIVGHEPGLGEFAAWLIGARQPLPFKKGGVARIDLAEWPVAARQGTLVWLATPKMLRALA